MANLLIDNVKSRTYDAIVIGSGMSGGWAAKELTQLGLRTLMLERGRQVNHVTDYPTANLNLWELEHRGQVPLHIRQEYSIASRNYAFHEDTMHFFAKDSEQPYVQEKPYDRSGGPVDSWLPSWRSLIDLGTANTAVERSLRRPGSILKGRPVMGLQSIGPSVMLILPPGTVVSRSS